MKAHILLSLSVPMMVACAAAQQPASSQPAVAASSPPVPVAPLDSASMEVRSWGRLLHRWSVKQDGAVEYVVIDAPLGAPDPKASVRRFKLDLSQQESLRAALDKAETARKRPAQCESEITDQPYGKVAWAVGNLKYSYDWTANCVQGRDADLALALREADSLVGTLATGVTPSETRDPTAAELGR